jgi:hypothetical protein
MVIISFKISRKYINFINSKLKSIKILARIEIKSYFKDHYYVAQSSPWTFNK